MNNRLVIDTCVYVNYAVYNKIYRLAHVARMYNVKIFVNEKLLQELRSNLQRLLEDRIWDKEVAMDEVLDFVTYIDTYSEFTQSPDPKDNFLFDLALQTNSEVIVTKENALLNFKESPIPIHDIKWFKEKFPVPQ